LIGSDGSLPEADARIPSERPRGASVSPPVKANTKSIREAIMARKGGPALYELLSSPKNAGPSLGAPRTPAATGAAFEGAQAKVLLWIAVGVVAVVIAYLVGVSRGERIGRAAGAGERDEEMRLLAGGRPSLDAQETRGERAATPEASARSVQTSENQARTDGNGIAGGQALEDGPLPPLQKGVDPRQPGLNYFVLATVMEPNAVAIAQFCREKGLDAYVIPSDNRRFSEVIVLPGFPASERSGAAVKGLQERIRKVGVLYKNAARGNPDFGDMYHKLYKP
jgi:hypothetical protein